MSPTRPSPGHPSPGHPSPPLDWSTAVDGGAGRLGGGDLSESKSPVTGGPCEPRAAGPRRGRRRSSLSPLSRPGRGAGAGAVSAGAVGAAGVGSRGGGRGVGRCPQDHEKIRTREAIFSRSWEGDEVSGGARTGLVKRQIQTKAAGARSGPHNRPVMGLDRAPRADGRRRRIDPGSQKLSKINLQI